MGTSKLNRKYYGYIWLALIFASYVRGAIPDEGITLNFTVNFNELGRITSIIINFGEIAG